MNPTSSFFKNRILTKCSLAHPLNSCFMKQLNTDDKKWCITMIRKTDENLLNWIYEHVIDFTDENDTSGLTWESSRADAAKFLHSITSKRKSSKIWFLFRPRSFLSYRFICRYWGRPWKRIHLRRNLQDNSQVETWSQTWNMEHGRCKRNIVSWSSGGRKNKTTIPFSWF